MDASIERKDLLYVGRLYTIKCSPHLYLRVSPCSPLALACHSPGQLTTLGPGWISPRHCHHLRLGREAQLGLTSSWGG